MTSVPQWFCVWSWRYFSCSELTAGMFGHGGVGSVAFGKREKPESRRDLQDHKVQLTRKDTQYIQYEKILLYKLRYSHSSYKSCLPETHRRDIQRLSRLARYQIRKTLKRFLRKLGDCSAGVRNLKLKYLMELSTVEPAYGSESFNMHHSGWLEQSEQERVKSIRVSGEGGIQIQTTEHQVGLWIGFYLNCLKEN